MNASCHAFAFGCGFLVAKRSGEQKRERQAEERRGEERIGEECKGIYSGILTSPRLASPSRLHVRPFERSSSDSVGVDGS